MTKTMPAIPFSACRSSTPPPKALASSRPLQSGLGHARRFQDCLGQTMGRQGCKSCPVEQAAEEKIPGRQFPLSPGDCGEKALIMDLAAALQGLERDRVLLSLILKLDRTPGCSSAYAPLTPALRSGVFPPAAGPDSPPSQDMTDVDAPAPPPQGAVSSRFESGGEGVGAVGHDRTGGTSYGLYQISSRQGTMEQFLRSLEKDAPHWAARLRTAGPADTGGTEGGMPEEWRRIALEDPVRFGALQHEFARRSLYEPACRAVLTETGLDVRLRSGALRQVLWSTAIQHGTAGAADVFAEAFAALNAPRVEPSDQALIKAVYEARGRRFGSSTPGVRAAVLERFRAEEALVLAMLEENGTQPA